MSLRNKAQSSIFTVALVAGCCAAFTPAVQAMPNCQGGWSPFGGGGYCDGTRYMDGSYDHCVNVSVLGFGGMQCGRVCPPVPDNPAIPLPWPGPGPEGRC